MITVGQQLNLTYRGQKLTAEVVEVEILGTGDRFAYSKRDSNPVMKIWTRIPGLKLQVHTQMELNDEALLRPLETLAELIKFSLTKQETKPL
jgi:hypothetical protein